jgi:cyclase
MRWDGTRDGYDIQQLQAVRQRISIPLVASGGAGGLHHFVRVFREASVEGALAASVFHRGELTVADVKTELLHARIPVRPVTLEVS